MKENYHLMYRLIKEELVVIFPQGGVFCNLLIYKIINIYLMKKWMINFCMIVIVGNLQILAAQERVSSIRETLLNPHAEKVLVVAHRGD